MVWQQALYLVNLLCKFVPCDYNFAAPDTSLSEPQAFKDLITLDYDKDNPGSLKIGGKGQGQLKGQGWGLDRGEEVDYTGEDPLVVVTGSGKLRGYWMRVVGGRKIRAFEGIPYAEPPIGYFRFAEASPKIPWSGMLWAGKKGPKCLQFSQTELNRVVGSEDCLCLNIYAPPFPSNYANSPSGKGPKFPVIIFLHGGGFQVGGGNDFGPSYLLQQDLILVTLNYRVGVFGFMSTGDGVSPGNYGLKDQSLGIRWIYENIDAFHGDRLRITLLGQEAGGASVHLQMLSLRARPYFQGAVAMSGSAFSPWVICSKKGAVDLTKAYAKKLKCPTHSSQAIVSCLRRKDAGDLAKAQIKFLDDLPIPIYLFRPIIEDFSGENGEMMGKEPPFISLPPEEIYRKDLVHKIPLITGYTEDEGLTFLLPSVFRGTLKQLRSHWNQRAPDFLDYENLESLDQEEVTKKINWLYFKQKTPLTATVKTFSDMISLRYTVAGVHKTLQAHSPLAPTYAYMFAYNGKYNLATLAGIKPQEWGVGQGEDVFYLLNSSHLYQGFKKSDHEMILSKIMVNLFGNFASKRVPAFSLESGEDFPLWEPVLNPQNMSFLLIHKKIKMIPEPYLKQTIYWEGIGHGISSPYINSSEHYRDYHFQLNPNHNPNPPPVRFLPPNYSLGSLGADVVFDLRANLSNKLEKTKNNSNSEDEITKLQLPEEVEESEPNPKKEAEEQEERDKQNIRNFNFGGFVNHLEGNLKNHNMNPTIEPIKLFEGNLLNHNMNPITTTTTPTTTTTTTTASPESDENLLFLPPWNPFGNATATITIATTPPQIETGTTTQPPAIEETTPTHVIITEATTTTIVPMPQTEIEIPAVIPEAPTTPTSPVHFIESTTETTPTFEDIIHGELTTPTSEIGETDSFQANEGPPITTPNEEEEEKSSEEVDNLQSNETLSEEKETPATATDSDRDPEEEEMRGQIEKYKLEFTQDPFVTESEEGFLSFSTSTTTEKPSPMTPKEGQPHPLPIFFRNSHTNTNPISYYQNFVTRSKGKGREAHISKEISDSEPYNIM